MHWQNPTQQYRSHPPSTDVARHSASVTVPTWARSRRRPAATATPSSLLAAAAAAAAADASGHGTQDATRSTSGCDVTGNKTEGRLPGTLSASGCTAGGSAPVVGGEPDKEEGSVAGAVGAVMEVAAAVSEAPKAEIAPCGVALRKGGVAGSKSASRSGSNAGRSAVIPDNAVDAGGASAD